MDEEYSRGWGSRFGLVDNLLSIKQVQNGFVVKYLRTTRVYNNWNDVIIFIQNIATPKLEEVD